MAFRPPPPAVTPARPKAAPASGLPKAAPKPPQAAPAVPFVPPGFKAFVPAKPKPAGLAGSRAPADHFVPRDPPQSTTGVRQHPPADRQRSVPADRTPMGRPFGWQPFGNVPR